MNKQMTLSSDLIQLNFLQTLKGLLVLLIASAAFRYLSLAQIHSILGAAKHYCIREITVSEAHDVRSSLHQASYLFPGRVACLEMSLAFILLSLSKRLAATWCLGVATNPFYSHAWIEVENQPFCEADYVEKLFIKLVSV